jgi:radical SAM-linked protein
LKVRYAIKFSKESHIKFISHLDLMRTLQRVIRRAKLPVEYSKGFNPHMTLSIAQPLSVGMYSYGEYLDIVLTEELEEDFIKKILNGNCPTGIRILEVIKVKSDPGDKKVPQSMALINAASYSIKIKYTETGRLEENIEAIQKAPQWVTTKKSKSGEKVVDIKPMVRELKYKIEDNMLQLDVLVSCGSKENLSPELLAAFIKSNSEDYEELSFMEIQRKELYTISGDKLISLSGYFGR